MITSHDEFFAQATGGLTPHGYQRRVATGPALPALIEVPPGYGKTAAIVLGWLWRRRYHADTRVRSTTPRRLVYALPQRALTDQVTREVRQWLQRLEIDDIDLHVVMGGRGRAAAPWRSAPERDSILVGTIDMIASKALVRAYGTPRHVYPMDAALVWNDAHVVVDEVQAAPSTTVTFRQIEAFRRGATHGPTGLTCMSATVPARLLDTVDNPEPTADEVIRLGTDDDTDDLRRRRAATRTIRRMPADRPEPRSIAQHALSRHRAGRLTLIIANTVRTARDIHAALIKVDHLPVTLLHSQFRPVDRVPKLEELTNELPSEGRIVVATQVVEAGIDIDADVLVTEMAPWPSFIQRSGRCNRRGLIQDAELWWWSPARAVPYEQEDLTRSQDALLHRDGLSITNESLLDAGVDVTPVTPMVLRRADFHSLFDTAPDLSGHDLDIGPYIRDTEDLAAQLCWMNWEATRPPDDLRPPAPEHRCRVPLAGVAELVKAKKQVWRFDPVDGAWRTLPTRSPARPGDVLVMRADAGGYREDVGFDPKSTATVRVSHGTAEADDATESEDAAGSDERSFGGAWMPLDQHLTETADEAATLVTALGIESAIADDIVLAARLHDVGKAHPTWQDALCGTAATEGQSFVTAGRPWAKSADSRRRLRYASGVKAFRHELAGVLLLDGPLAILLRPAHDPDLVCYLVLAHHGKLRVQARDPDPRPDQLFGLRSGEYQEIPDVLGQSSEGLVTTLERFDLTGTGAIDAWPDVVARLLARYGMFRLALFESLVRVADWRASARHNRGVGAQ